jgi:hypothetical protein
LRAARRRNPARTGSGRFRIFKFAMLPMVALVALLNQREIAATLRPGLRERLAANHKSVLRAPGTSEVALSRSRRRRLRYPEVDVAGDRS